MAAQDFVIIFEEDSEDYDQFEGTVVDRTDECYGPGAHDAYHARQRAQRNSSRSSESSSTKPSASQSSSSSTTPEAPKSSTTASLSRCKTPETASDISLAPSNTAPGGDTSVHANNNGETSGLRKLTADRLSAPSKAHKDDDNECDGATEGASEIQHPNRKHRKCCTATESHQTCKIYYDLSHTRCWRITCEACPICQEYFVPNDEILFHKCRCGFHESCLQTWLDTNTGLAQSPTCPNCRSSIYLKTWKTILFTLAILIPFAFTVI